MAVLAQSLLRSQQCTHAAAELERRILTQPAFDVPVSRAFAAELHAEARRLAGAFAVFADFYPAANDEPPTP